MSCLLLPGLRIHRRFLLRKCQIGAGTRNRRYWGHKRLFELAGSQRKEAHVCSRTTLVKHSRSRFLHSSMADCGFLRVKQNAQIKIIVFLTVFCLIVVLYLQGQSIIKPSVSAFSWIVTVVSGCLFLWDRWIWHWQALYRLSMRPDLRGTWKAEIKSLWNEPAVGSAANPIQVYLVF